YCLYSCLSTLLPLSCSCVRPPPSSTLFPYTTLFRSGSGHLAGSCRKNRHGGTSGALRRVQLAPPIGSRRAPVLHGLRIFGLWRPDRKSTRLNSSHVSISYAVFCLKKKKKQLHYQISS